MEPENLGLEMSKAFAGEAGKESVNKLSSAIHGLFPFWGLKAKAIDVYVREIENSGLSPEAKMFAIANAKKTYKEVKNQSAIVNSAISAIGSGPTASFDRLADADEELVLRLLDAGKYVSDEELQLLWGNVLAGEFENPGGTPKSVIRILSDISKDEAAIFSNLCSLRLEILADTGDDIHHVGYEFMVFNFSDYLQEIGINFDAILELEKLGLLSLSNVGHYNRRIPHGSFPYVHIVCEDCVMTVINSEEDFPTGRILLTKAGQCISRFIPARYNQQHMKNVKSFLESELNIKFSPTPGIRATTESKGEGTCTEYSYEKQPITPPQTPESR